MLSFGKFLDLRGAGLVLVIFWTAVSVLSLIGLIVFSVNESDWVTIYISVIFLLLGIYKLFFERYVTLLRRYRLFCRMYGASEWLRTVSFLMEDVVIEEGQRTERYPYSAIKCYREKGDAIHLCFSHRAGLLIYRDAFAEGSWEECRTHLEARGITKKNK